MCGFTGFVEYKYAMEHSEALRVMTAEIAHRGPDSEGFYEDQNIGLGFRRLSIIGITNGKQPLFNEDKSKVLVFNGEIYNYKSLRGKLKELGHEFTTDSDSEVLIHGYEEYGKDILSKLRGMYAFVIWDVKEKSLFLARDGFGIKPLYYYKKGNSLVFGSEIKSILKHPSYEKKLNERALYSFLSFQYSALYETFFEGINELPPGHYAEFKNGNITLTQYWDPTFEQDDSLTMQEAVTQIENVFEDSVNIHLTSDTEVGSFLSGGVDSSYVVSTAKCPKTFTVGFDEPGYSEIEYAKELAKQLGVKNYSKLITADEYWDSIPKVMYHMDEPVADPAAVALYFVSKLAAEQVKVVCSGEGADELFGGYNIYQTPLALRPLEKIPFCIRKGVASLMKSLPLRFKGKEYLIRLGTPLSERFIGNAYIFKEKEINRLLKKPKGVSPAKVVSGFYDKVKDFDPVTQMQYVDMKGWLRGDILRKADRMSMAHSLELRVPFLDYEVMKVAGKLPESLKVDNATTKKALRIAALKNTPKASTQRRKLGFPVPIKKWMGEAQYQVKIKEALFKPYMKELFDEKEMRQLLDNHAKKKRDNSRKIWCLYCFSVWYDVYFVQDQVKGE